jgi:ferrous iron transport protein B
MNARALTKSIYLVGMPNVGKSALFNALTDSSQKVANFTGATVDIKQGQLSQRFSTTLTSAEHSEIQIFDLPGLYSLDVSSIEEKLARDFLLDKLQENPSKADLSEDEKDSLFFFVADATQLKRSLYLWAQLQYYKLPFELILTRTDLLEENQKEKIAQQLQQNWGVKPWFVTAKDKDQLISTISSILNYSSEKIRPFDHHRVLPPGYKREISETSLVRQWHEKIQQSTQGLDFLSPVSRWSQRIDHWLLHPLWGNIFMFLLLLLMFETLFAWSAPLQDLIETGISALSVLSEKLFTHPLALSFIQGGLLGGVGGVVVFLPQIVLLFFFIQILEEVGYLARMAFLVDGWFRRFGLPGKAIVPLLSSHACAIPGILSTRILENKFDRLAIMLSLPLTTCSARLPVFSLLVSLLVTSDQRWLGFRLSSWLMLLLYVVSFVFALILAIIIKWGLQKKSGQPFSSSGLFLELPDYQWPDPKNLLHQMGFQAKLFLEKAGKIILLLSLVIWAAVTFPLSPEGLPSAIEFSWAASLGRTLDPLFSPLGFDWRLTTALIPSLGAREVLVSALMTVFSVQADASLALENLAQIIQTSYSPATLVALLTWFIFSPQCISTFAVLYKESRSSKLTFVFGLYTVTLAWLMSWIVYQTLSHFIYK